MQISNLPGFKLPSKHILHTVGPVYSANRKAECEAQLESCYNTTLQLAIEHNLKTVALCGVSTGIYGFPLQAATETALKTVREVLEDNVDKVGFCDLLSRGTVTLTSTNM